MHFIIKCTTFSQHRQSHTPCPCKNCRSCRISRPEELVFLQILNCVHRVLTYGSAVVVASTVRSQASKVG